MLGVQLPIWRTVFLGKDYNCYNCFSEDEISKQDCFASGTEEIKCDFWKNAEQLSPSDVSICL